jgi:hypothetical protein
MVYIEVFAMSTLTAVSATAEFKQRVSRLAVHRPYGDGELTVELVRRQLVLTAAFEAGNQGFTSLADCRESCATLWGLDLDIDELRGVVSTLTAAHRLEKTAGRFVLTDAARAELNGVVDRSKAIEATALAEWETAVRSIASELSKDDISTLRTDLLAWLQRIISHYGTEAALILYPEEERARQFFEDVEELGFDFLPKRDQSLTTARPAALYLFIRHPTAAQRAYIANLMTTAYMVAVFTLDPAAQQLVQAITRGQRIYLDTNVLYSGLNLNGPHAYLSTKRVLDMTRALGYELSVTPWTIAEMKESIRHGRDELSRTSLPPRALAEIAADAGGEGSFITAYWRKYKESGVTAKDFCDLHDQVEGLVERLGIAIVDEGCTAVDHRREAIAEHMSLIEHVRGGGSKSDRVKEHDVKHRLLIERLRGSHDRKFSSAGYWFLTRDGVLVPYGLADRSAGALPFAVSLTAWAQIVRGFTPRTEDFDQTLVDLLDTPSLRPRGSVINHQTIAEVLGRIDLMVEDSTEEVAARVMLDSAAMVEVEAKSGDERASQIEAVVAEKSHEMERQLADSRRQLEAERTARAETEARAAKAGAEFASERERADAERTSREAVESALADLSGQVGRERLAAEECLAAAEAHAATTAEQRSERSKRIIRRSTAAVVALSGIAVGAVPAVAGWLNGWSLVGVIIVGGLLVALGVWMGIHSKAARLFLTIAVTLVGVVAGIHEIVASSGHSSTQQTHEKPHR